MKRIIKTAFFLTAFVSVGFTVSSCQDAIEIEQPGQLDDNAIFTNVGNLNSFLLGSVYSSMETSSDIYFTAVFTDEVKPGNGSGGQEFQLHRHFLDASDGVPGGIWSNHYRLINRVNRLIAGAQLFTPAASEQAQYNNIIAQARALRAYAYVQLLAYYSPDMKNSGGLGVIITEGIPETDAKLPRSSNQAVFDVINGDLDFARATLSYSAASNAAARFYVDKGFVNALSARFNIYRGNATLAKQYAQDVISNSGLSLTVSTPITTTSAPTIGSAAWNSAFYGVASSFNPYRNLWNDSARGEIIFSLNRLATGVGANVGTNWNTNTSSVSGVPMWFLGRNLFNLVNTGSDVRRYTYIDPTSIIDPNYATSTSPITSDRLVIDKYPGKTSAPTRNDLKLFRLSEMYFILAEAETAGNNLSAAQAAIQAVRVARNYNGTATTPVYGNAQTAYADILKERRIELGLEGHRYIDLKRMAVQAGVTMDRNPTDDIISVTNLANGSYKYTLPIPFTEISANPNIQQNPGY
ncbi:RagB/SusD family nutrient uptake outer membrane protein [Chryseobacterium sp. GP-SGM7]|uniref:RagB/SusD family nutrient uptake outer membrane protein n=1 Tax=Chryseobacterium sp. GP-SGM7 TaxID=3411323 RepID=UPI003B945B2E